MVTARNKGTVHLPAEAFLYMRVDRGGERGRTKSDAGGQTVTDRRAKHNHVSRKRFRILGGGERIIIIIFYLVQRQRERLSPPPGKVKSICILIAECIGAQHLFLRDPLANDISIAALFDGVSLCSQRKTRGG